MIWFMIWAKRGKGFSRELEVNRIPACEVAHLQLITAKLSTSFWTFQIFYRKKFIQSVQKVSTLLTTVLKNVSRGSHLVKLMDLCSCYFSHWRCNIILKIIYLISLLHSLLYILYAFSIPTDLSIFNSLLDK